MAAPTAPASPNPVAGRVVLLSIGMSNTTQEFQRFIQVAAVSRRGRPKPAADGVGRPTTGKGGSTTGKGRPTTGSPGR